MSTGAMPNPPDQPDTQTSTAGAQAQIPGSQAVPQSAPPVASTATNAPASSGTGTTPTDAASAAPAAPPAPVTGADLAAIIESQLDVIAQRMLYHSQLLLGVSAMGLNTVSSKTSALIIARSLREGNAQDAEYALVSTGDPLLSQVNDQSLPFKINAQVAGLLEGILLDTVTQAYVADPARVPEARAILERVFQPANERMQMQSKAMINFQAPGPHPNARV